MATYCRHPYIHLRAGSYVSLPFWWVNPAEQSRSIFGERRRNVVVLGLFENRQIKYKRFKSPRCLTA